MAKYITIPIITDPQVLIRMSIDYLQARVPTWEPAEGNLDTWMIDSTAGQAAEVRDLASQVPQAIMRWFGSSIMGIQPEEASPARATTTWIAIDTAGHFIPAGTQVSIMNLDTPITFSTVVDAAIPPGDDRVTGVLIQAVRNGENGNDLGGNGVTIDLLDILDFVDHVETDEITSDGADAETDDDYLDRLTTELQLMTPRPILPRDFAVLAHRVPGVARALPLDNYNPVNDTWDNERMITIAGIDVDGEGVSEYTRGLVEAFLQAMREVNFEVHTIDPTYTTIAVTCSFRVRPRYESDPVIAAVESALGDYLDPAAWGGTSDPMVWNNVTVVRYLEIAEVINRVEGVDYIEDLTLGKEGDTLTTDNVTLEGVATLPRVGTLTVTTV